MKFGIVVHAKKYKSISKCAQCSFTSGNFTSNLASISITQPKGRRSRELSGNESSFSIRDGEVGGGWAAIIAKTSNMTICRGNREGGAVQPLESLGNLSAFN